MTLFLLLLTAVMGYATIRVAMRDRPKNQSDFYSKRKDEPYETTDDDHLTLKGYYVGVASGTATTILTFLLALGLWRSLNFENATNAFITLVFCGVCVFFAWGYITLFRERFVAQEMATHQKATAEKDKQESDERYEREFKERQEARNAAEAAARVPRVPEDVRNEHMMVVAGTGHGKTQLLQSMLVNDLQKNAPIIVIDSQEGMLERLLHVVPEDRLMYLDGSTSLALSPFEIGDTGDDARVTMALDLFENMFAALETAMTTKQATLYRYLSRLLMEIPGATFETALDLLSNSGLSGYEKYIRQLSGTPRKYFDNQFMDKSYNETKKQIAERLYTLLDNGAIDRMFNAPAGKVDIDQAIRERKVILINTAQSQLGTKGASIFGRYCLLQIALEILRRPETEDRVYFYIDEAQEYLTDSPIIRRLFEQGRKRGLCMIVAFHWLGQMGGDLSTAMRSLTSLKFIGSLNAADGATMCRDMGIDPVLLDYAKKKLRFLWSINGQPPKDMDWRYEVTAGLLEAMPKRPPHEIAALKRRMLELYGYEPTPPTQSASTGAAVDPDAEQKLD